MLDVVAVVSMLGQGPMVLDYRDIEFYPRNWREWVPDSLPRLPSSFEQFIPAPVLAWLQPYRRPDAPPSVAPLRFKLNAKYLTVCQKPGPQGSAAWLKGMAAAVNDKFLHPEPWLAQAMENREYIRFEFPDYDGQTPSRDLVIGTRYETDKAMENCEGRIVRRIALPGVNPPFPQAQLNPPVEKIDGQAPTANARPQQAPTPLVPGAGKKNPVDGIY